MGFLKATFFVASLTYLQVAQSSPFWKTESTGLLTKRGPATPAVLAANKDYLTADGTNCLVDLHPDCWVVLKMDDYIKG